MFIKCSKLSGPLSLVCRTILLTPQLLPLWVCNILSLSNILQLIGSFIGIMCYFLFWLIQLPLLLVSPQRIRHFFTAKSIIVPGAWLAILIWAMVRHPAKVSLASQRSSLSGRALGWAWLNALNSSLGVYATVAVNIPDFTVRKNRRASVFHNSDSVLFSVMLKTSARAFFSH